MKHWKSVELGNHCEIFSGFPFESSKFTSNSEDVHLVKGENLHQGYIDWEKAKRWNYAEWGELIKYQLRTNDIVLAMDRPWIEAGLKWSSISKSNPKALLVQRVACLRAKNNLSQFFLKHTIASYLFSNYLRLVATGINVPHISLKQIQKFNLFLPPLSIQRKIAAVLSAYDDLIENNNRRIAILEKMAEELYREWFVRLRFPGHEKTKIIKGIPEGWEVKRLGDIVNAIMGQSPPSESYNQTGIGLPFNQGVGTYGQRYPHKTMYCNAKGRIVGCGSILISVRAPVGRLNIADCKMIIGRGLAGLNHKNGLNSYLFYLLRDKFSTEDLIGNGSIFNSVTRDELLGLKILDPSRFLVEEFEKTVLPIDKSIGMVLKKKDFLQIARDKLLSRLMSGKIDLENLDIQFPASMQENT
jgi:type I restriction enzyme S subunit